MATITTAVVIERGIDEVWADVADLASHVTWMADAESIRFHSGPRSGVGTTFTCRTKVGPIRLDDVMVITTWEPRRSIGVHHRGVVSGHGAFTLTDLGPDRTGFTWREELAFPWWLGGPLGAAIGRPILTAIWTRNLARLKQRLAPPGPAA